jgi:thiosulfate dehydrogenase [quinone] large subunit
MSEQTNKSAAVADAEPSAPTASDCCSPAADCAVSDKLALLSGSVLLRVWLGVRTFQSGIEKFSTSTLVERPQLADGMPTGLVETVSVKAYSLGAYKGIPDALKSVFADQPMIPGFMLPIYNAVLGPALLILGLSVLLGIASRVSLLLMGLLYVSLTWGLVIWGEPGNSGVAYLGIHIVLIVMALQLTRHDPLRVLKKW